MNRIYTVSELLLYQSCPSKWAYKHYAKRRLRREPSSALDRGIALHTALEYAASTHKVPRNAVEWLNLLVSAYEKNVLERGAEPNASQLDELDILAYGLESYADMLPFKNVLGAEVPLVARTQSGHTIQGKLDALCEEDGALWLRQYKSKSASREIPDFVQLIRRSLHESVYRMLVEANYDRPYRGTELVIFTLDALHKQQKGAECAHCNRRGYEWRGSTPYIDKLRVDAPLVTKRYSDVMRVIAQIEQDTRTLEAVDWPACGGPPPTEQRESACLDRYTRKLCYFMPICDLKAGADVLDETFFESYDPLARYAEGIPT